MQVTDFFNNITGGATSAPFPVHAGRPMTIASRGLAGAETVKLQIMVNGTATDVYKATALVQLAVTNKVMQINETGVYVLVASATAGGLYVEGTVSDV